MRQEATINSQITIGIRLIVGLVFLYIVWSLSKNLVELSKQDERLINAREEVDILIQTNNELQAEAEKVGTSAHEEGLIRDNLGLVRPGETLVIIPEESLIQSTGSSSIASVARESTDYPVWLQWLFLFL